MTTPDLTIEGAPPGRSRCVDPTKPIESGRTIHPLADHIVPVNDSK